MAGRKRIKRSSGGRIDLGSILAGNLAGGIKMDETFAPEDTIGETSFEKPMQSDTPFKGKWYNRSATGALNNEYQLQKQLGNLQTSQELDLLRKKSPIDIAHMSKLGEVQDWFNKQATEREVQGRMGVASHGDKIARDFLNYSNEAEKKQFEAMAPLKLEETKKTVGATSHINTMAEQEIMRQKQLNALAEIKAREESARNVGNFGVVNTAGLINDPEGENAKVFNAGTANLTIGNKIAGLNAGITASQLADQEGRLKFNINEETRPATVDAARDAARIKAAEIAQQLKLQPESDELARWKAKNAIEIEERKKAVLGIVSGYGGVFDAYGNKDIVPRVPSAAQIKSNDRQALLKSLGGGNVDAPLNPNMGGSAIGKAITTNRPAQFSEDTELLQDEEGNFYHAKTGKKLFKATPKPKQ